MPRFRYLDRKRPEVHEYNPATLNPRQVAEKVLGSIEWTGENFGVCNCPAEHLHTNKTGKNHTRVYINNEYPPVVKCNHASCFGEVEEINKRLYFEAKAGGTFEAMPAQYNAEATRKVQERERIEHAKDILKKEYDSILSNYSDKLPKGESIPSDPVQMFNKHLRLFKKDDILFHGNTFDTHTFKAAGEWAKFAQDAKRVPNQYICQSNFINNPTGRLKDQVHESPYLVVEGDNSEKPEQIKVLNFLIACGFNLVAVIDSGNKSLHGWFRRPKNYTEQEITALMECLQCDPASTRIAQPVRVAGGENAKTGNVQRLLYYNKAAPDAEPMPFDRIFTKADELPEIIDIGTFLETEYPKPPELIAGLLHQGEKMILSADSKMRKTFTLLDLALSLHSGKTFLGMETAKSKVLFINFELENWLIQQRTRNILTGRNMQFDRSHFDFLNLKSYAQSIDILVPIFLKHMERSGGNFGAIIIDPIYKTLGDRDENSASDINDLMNEFSRLSNKTGASVIICQHFAKGGGAGKSVNDRASGSGVFARDPDTICTMTQDERLQDEFDIPEGYGAVFEASIRAFKPMAPRVLEWKDENCAWTHREEIDWRKKPEKKGRNAKTINKKEIIELIGEGRPRKESIEVLAHLFNIKPEQAKAEIQKLIKSFVLFEDENGYITIN